MIRGFMEDIDYVLRNARTRDIIKGLIKHRLLGDELHDEFFVYQGSGNSSNKIVDDIMNSPEFGEIISELQYAVDEGKIYRGLAVKSAAEFIRKLERGDTGWYDGVGKYWTYDIAAASPIWGESGDEVRLCGTFKDRDVDWIATIGQAISHNWEEKEIRLKSGAVISVYRVDIGDFSGDLNSRLNAHQKIPVDLKLKVGGKGVPDMPPDIAVDVGAVKLPRYDVHRRRTVGK